jgi:hypothetical protein
MDQPFDSALSAASEQSIALGEQQVQHDEERHDLLRLLDEPRAGEERITILDVRDRERHVEFLRQLAAERVAWPSRTSGVG